MNRASLLSHRRRSRRTSELPSIPHGPAGSPSLASTIRTSNVRDANSRPPSTGLFATFSRQVSESSVAIIRGTTPQTGSSDRRDTVFYEHQEERPLVHMEDLGMRNAPITHITVSPLPRQSRLSRWSSVLIPRDAARDRTQGHHEEEVNWQRPLTRDSLEIARQVQRRQNGRLPHYDAQPQESQEDNRHHRGRLLTSTTRQSPRADSPVPSSLLALSSSTFSTRRSRTLNSAEAPHSIHSAPSQLSRLARIRRSISPSFDMPSFVRRSPTQDIVAIAPPQRLIRDPFPIRRFISPTSMSNAPAGELNRITTISHDDTYRRAEHRGSQGSLDFLDPESSDRRSSSWADRWADRSSGGRRENRRVSSMLSGRSTRTLRRDQEGPLPRILNLAALALAARLAGSDARHTHEIQSIGPDALDGNSQDLFQSLQDTINLTPGDTASAEGIDGTGLSTGPVNPLGYLRVFRFVSITAGTSTDALSPNPAQQYNSPVIDEERAGQDLEGRTVTLVVIGVRSIPMEDPLRQDTRSSEPAVDSALDVRSLGSSSNMLSADIGNSPRPASAVQSIANPRRASLSGFAPFPADYDSQRHQRTPNSQGPHSDDGTISPEAAPSPSLPSSDSPPGPRPPPSTPAEPILSTHASQVATLSRRPSLASAIQQAQVSSREAATSQLREAADPVTPRQGQPTQHVQNRRRSEPEHARNRDLGAGAARRNGVVAPDEIDNPAPAIGTSRSWLIYVVGTNIAEDHPAVTAPSLFTDVSEMTTNCSIRP